jgi:hypothetical protein
MDKQQLIMYPIKAASSVKMITDPHEKYESDKKAGKTTFWQRLKYEYIPYLYSL